MLALLDRIEFVSTDTHANVSRVRNLRNIHFRSNLADGSLSLFFFATILPPRFPHLLSAPPLSATGGHR